MTTFKIILAYDGAGFVGWQRQTSGTSIQGLLEDALRALDARDVPVTGAGRTDAGVHALGQVASFSLARALGVRAVFAERQDGTLLLRRGFAVGETDRVLVVEDVLTTGGSTRETMQVATASGAHVIGVAAIVDRSGGTASFEVPFHSLIEVALPAYEPDKCPLCAQGLPVVKPGSRAVLT